MNTIGKLQHSIASPRGAPASVRSARRVLAAAAPPKVDEVKTKAVESVDPHKDAEQGPGGLGDLLGPIGLTYSAGIKTQRAPKAEVTNREGVALGPIALSFGNEFGDQPSSSRPEGEQEPDSKAESIHSMTTAEWRAKYEKDGMVDLWLEEEFNAGSRLVGGRAVHKGGMYGIMTGEGPSVSDAPRHRVVIHNHYADQVVEVDVPEDRYILWEAEDEGLQLPYACRMGCCTACAVRIKEGEMYQPEALGISAELREQGYALMCVGFPLTDMVLETVPEDEVYDLQFGTVFASQALNPEDPQSIERDDYALSIANMDE